MRTCDISPVYAVQKAGERVKMGERARGKMGGGREEASIEVAIYRWVGIRGGQWGVGARPAIGDRLGRSMRTTLPPHRVLLRRLATPRSFPASWVQEKGECGCSGGNSPCPAQCSILMRTRTALSRA